MNFTDIMSLVDVGTISFDDLKEYSENVHMIFEAYENGQINHDQREELMLENKRVLFDLFEEKATRVEYTMRQFKKKYHYDPQKKTIIVNGETYKCDLDIKSKTMDVKNPVTGETVTTVRQTAAALGDPDRTIALDRSFFELKNNKRRDAILQHEVGHQKLHSISSDDFDVFIDTLVNNTVSQLGDIEQYGLTIEDIRSEIIDQLKKNGVTGNNFKGTPDEKLKNLRSSIRKDLEKKFVGKLHKNNDHVNANEFEADRYAINKTSKNQLKKGLREAYKKIGSDKGMKRQIDGVNEVSRKNSGMSKSEFNQSGMKVYKDKELINTARKEQNKMGKEDYNQRVRAMNHSGIEKDKEKNKIYQ